MENASKALIMAGSILISIIVISMLILVINSLTDYQSINDDKSRVDEISAFNNEYEAYNKENVRGSELYSLTNKVVDYNKRKSTAGTTDDSQTYQGQYVGYEPIKININLNNDPTVFTYDNKNRLLTNNKKTYEISGIKNDFEDFHDKIQTMEDIYPSGSLENLSGAITKIFITPTGDADEQKKQKVTAINNFNNCYGSYLLGWEDDSKINVSWRCLVEGNMVTIRGKQRNIQNDVYTYYEYIQFKRGIFKCVGVESNPTTGRITQMNFEFTGNFN